jgi:hypothetical protein
MAVFGNEGGNSGGGSGGRSSVAALVSAVNATTAGWGSTQDINATATGLTFSLPAIGVGDIAPTLKTISLRNVGTNPVILALAGGVLNSALGLSVLPGSIWTIEAQTLTTANVSATNASQPVAADVGTAVLSSNVSVLAGNNSTATAIMLTGLTFTAQETATYIVSLNLHGNQTAAAQNLTGFLVDTVTPAVAIIGSETLISVPGSIGEYSGSNTFSFSAVAGRTYQARAFNTSGVATAAVVSNANGRSTLTWQKTSGLPVSAIAGAFTGDRKFSDLLLDHSNWILLDGRLKTALTTAQQLVATSLGYGANIPDMRGRMALGIGGTIGATALSQGGSSTIAQNQLPNVTLSISGSAAQGGNGIWWYNGTTGNARMPNGGNVFDAQTITSLTVSGNTASINGGVAQQNYVPSYSAGNWFVWLGSSIGTVTTVQPLTLTNVGASSATFNSSTGVLNIPTPRKLIVSTAGNQTATNATYISQNNYATTIKNTFGAAWNNAIGVFTAPSNMDVRVVFSHGWSSLTINVATVLSLRIIHNTGVQNIIKDQTFNSTPQQSAQMTLEQTFSLLAGETLAFGAFQASGGSPTFVPPAVASRLSIVEEFG